MVENRVDTGTRVSFISIAANIALALLKLAAGIGAGSSAMVSDSMHSFSDSVSTVAVLVGLRIAGAPPDAEHPYGHGRAETVAAKLVALLLILTAVGVGYAAVQKLLSGDISQPGSLALWAALVSIIVKEGMYRYTAAVGHRIRSKALLADAWHHRTDALSSVTAFVGIFGARLGMVFLDPAAGLVVAAMVLKTGLSIYWQSIEELVDTAPPVSVLESISETAQSTPGVIHVNEIKARSHGPYVYVDLKICVDRTITVQAGHDIAHATAERLRALPEVKDVLVHVNPCPGDHLEQQKNAQ